MLHIINASRGKKHSNGCSISLPQWNKNLLVKTYYRPHDVIILPKSGGYLRRFKYCAITYLISPFVNGRYMYSPIMYKRCIVEATQRLLCIKQIFFFQNSINLHVFRPWRAIYSAPPHSIEPSVQRMSETLLESTLSRILRETSAPSVPARLSESWLEACER